MMTLVLGLLAFGLIHAIPVWTPGLRAAVIAKIGLLPWKGVFALASIGGIFLIVQGWPQMTPEPLYDLGTGSRHINLLLMPVAFALFVAPYTRTNLRRFVRNQQYTAVKLWSVGHLLANGDTRSLILFGGMLVWAVLMVIGVKKRDGAYEKPTNSSVIGDAVTVVLALGATHGIASMHPAWFGVVALPF